jgi:hypothetical protein
MQPPKNQSFTGGISIEINVGKADKNGIHRRKFARFDNAEELSMWYMQNSHNKDARNL